VFPEVRTKQKTIKETIRREEEAFNKTLDKGIELFEKAMLGRSLLPRGTLMDFVIRDDADKGEKFIDVLEITDNPDATQNVRVKADLAFRLYDTYGFPLDLTRLMARERGLTVDVAGFEKLMEEQRIRARASQKKSMVEILQDQYDTPTDFVGYNVFETDAQLLGTVNDSRGRQFAILDKSPFYA